MQPNRERQDGPVLVRRFHDRENLRSASILVSAKIKPLFRESENAQLRAGAATDLFRSAFNILHRMQLRTRRAVRGASVLCGQPSFIPVAEIRGFCVSLHCRILRIPFANSLRSGAVVGRLGHRASLAPARAPRVNGKLIIDPAAAGFDLRVDQSFGNCAKYIQARRARFPERSFRSQRRGACEASRAFSASDGQCPSRATPS